MFHASKYQSTQLCSYEVRNKSGFRQQTNWTTQWNFDTHDNLFIRVASIEKSIGVSRIVLTNAHDHVV